jgi:nicotinamidase-related amidase
MRLEREALLVVDMLNDFVMLRAPLEVEGAREIVPNMAERIDLARTSGSPVIYLCDSHGKEDPEFRVWPEHAVRGTEGAEVVEGLEPAVGDTVLHKTTYSGSFGTRLNDILRDKQITKLTITGVATSICILYTAVDAYMRGYSVEVPEDCVAGLNPEDHEFALKQIRRVLKPAEG